MLVSCCFQRASGSPPSGAVSSGTSKASRNGERNSGLAKRNGMRRRSRRVADGELHPPVPLEAGAGAGALPHSSSGVV